MLLKLIVCVTLITVCMGLDLTHDAIYLANTTPAKPSLIALCNTTKAVIAQNITDITAAISTAKAQYD